jgi:1-phosphofructokinase family hexose kinase
VILCAGLSPAWQHTLFFDRFEFGEVNRARKGIWCASGKVVNTAVALASLGVEHCMMTVVGSGWADAAFQHDLKANAVRYGLTSVQEPIRVCTTLLVNGQPTTELVEECGPLVESEVAAFRSPLIEMSKLASAIVIAGSMPKGPGFRFWRKVLEASPAPAVLDIRGPELLEALEAKPLLVKPNREELAATVGRPMDNERDVFAAAHELCNRGARWVLVTHGTEPALLVSDQENYRIHGVRVATLNPIGCGDALAASIAWRITQGDAVPDAVRWGVAAAAANAETELPARFARSRVEAHLPEIEIESVKPSR